MDRQVRRAAAGDQRQKVLVYFAWDLGCSLNHLRPAVTCIVRADFSWPAFAAASIVERIDELHKLPQVRWAGSAQVPGLSYRDRDTVGAALGLACNIQHPIRFKPGMRTLPLRAQRRRFPPDQVGHQDLQP